MVTLTTAYGDVPAKVSRLGGRIVTVTPEFAEVARIAREKSLPVREVLDEARADARRVMAGEPSWRPPTPPGGRRAPAEP
jgi:uncharacterized protein (DUF111 family)